MENHKFYNDQAFGLAIWAVEISDRLKSSKLLKVALKMESKYRKYNFVSCSKLPNTMRMAYAKGFK